MPDIHPARRPEPPAAPAARITSDAEAIAAAHRLAAAFAPGAGERDRDRRLPWDEIEAFSASGLGAMTVPLQHGGPGLSNATVAEVIAILAAADGSLGQLPQNQLGLWQMLHYADADAVKAWVYPRALDGFRFSSASAEVHSKTAADVTARARRDGADWVLSGRKGYGTAALFAHYVTVQVLDEAGQGTRAIIPVGAQGLTVVDDWSSFGQRTTASGTILMDDVRVPADHVFSTARLAHVPGLYGPVSQLIQAAIDLGIGRGAGAEALDFVRTKSRPWIDSGVERACDDPYTIAAVGDLLIRQHAAEALTRVAGETIDAGVGRETADSMARASVAVAEAKVLTTEFALLAANRLFELAGTRSTLSQHQLDRIWRDARVHTLHDPVRWKYAIVGRWHLNGIAPPRHAWV